MFKFVLSQYFMILAVLISFPLLFKSLFVLNNSLKGFSESLRVTAHSIRSYGRAFGTFAHKTCGFGAPKLEKSSFSRMF